MRRTLALSALALLITSSSFATVLSFEFSGDKTGDPPLRYVGRGFLDRAAFRYDYEEGNHALFRSRMSVRSADAGAIIAIIDNNEGTYFLRATKSMSGILSTYRAPWEQSIENVNVSLETLGRDEPLNDLRVSRIRLNVSYRILMDADGEKLSADVEGVAELSVIPKYRNPALPWGHQFALKTGWPEVDEQIADKIGKLGFPIRQRVTVTRTIEGGTEVTETSTFSVSRLREVAFAAAGFSPPPGYRFREPTFAGPAITDTGDDYGAPGPLMDETPVATTDASQTPAGGSLPIQEIEPGTAPPLFIETMEVRVVNVDVVVRDKQGNPVTGLTPDDFTVLENGQPVEITNFLEVTSSTGRLDTADATGTETTEAPTESLQSEAVRRAIRKIVLYLDQTTLEVQNRKTLIPAIKDFISNALRPGDEVMIASYQNGLKVDLQFTSNREVALEIIDRMAERTPLGQSRSRRLAAAQKALWDNILDYQPDEQPPYDAGLSDSRAYADSVRHDTNLAIGSLEALMKGLQAIDGRKLLVFATDALPSRPGNEIFIFFNEIKDLYAGGANQSPMSEGLQYDLSTQIDQLADTANATGFTLYPIQAATLSASFNSADLDGAMAYNINNATFAATEAQRASDREGLQTIARLTGGTLSLAANDFTKAFNSILDDLEHYYSIGYRAGGQRSDFVRSIKVNMKNKDLVARTRRSHVDRSIETEMEEIVAANLFYPIDRNDMGIKASASVPSPTGEAENVTLTLSVEIPTQTLTLIPQDDDVLGSFTLFIGFVRADGSVSKIARETRQFKFPASTMPRRKSVTMALEVTMDQTTDRISVGVLDPVSKATGFASVFIAPDVAAPSEVPSS
jgi:VWFA-related protein